jgi:hypothetical protein
MRAIRLALSGLLAAVGCAPPASPPPAEVDGLLRAALGRAASAFQSVPVESVFTVVSDDPGGPAADLARRADFFLARLRRELDRPDLAPVPAVILHVADAQRAAKLRTFLAGDAPVHALAGRHALVLLGPQGEAEAYVALAHEVAHAALRAALPPGLPLWLDEGLAQHWAARHAGELLTLRQVPHRFAPVPVAAPAPDDAPRLSARTAYPESPAELALFYRQSRRFVEEVDAARGPHPWLEILPALARDPAAWEETLKNQFSFPPEVRQRLALADRLAP